MKKKFCQIGKILLIALFLIGSLQLETFVPSVRAVTQKEIDSLKDEAKDFDAEKKELQQQINALENDKATALAKKQLLDEQSAAMANQIAAIEQIIANYDLLIEQTKAELADAEQREEIQYERFCKRVRAMEENGTVSYWSVLFNAEDFADLLSRLSDIQEIMDYDQGIIDSLKKLQTEISAKQADLEFQQAEQEQQKADLEARKAELDEQRASALALLNEIKADEAAAEALLAAKEKEYNRIQAEIKKKEQELAAQLNPATSGGYIWPTTSRYVTSPVGGRASPGGIGSTNHKGIDIGRVYYNSEVKAAKAGVVLTSAYSSSYGNYIVISHGTGNTTLYAHLSSRKVSAGQKVSQGQVIGITGSTGNSTGPHLHFEIRENGVIINPLQYLTNYIRGNW